MTRYKSNLLANFAGTGMAALLQLAFIPLYIRFLGIEAYGLIGFYIMLQSILQVLDLGMGPTMNREMARYSVHSDKAEEARDFARTLEAGYWVLGASAGAFIALAAPVISTRWVNAGALPVPLVRNALLLMGGLAAMQLPLTFYQGGLMGLQRQVFYNGVKIAASVLSSGGAVLVLWLVSPTITAFLAWQLLVNAFQTSVLGLALWRSLPAPGHTPRFTPYLLRNVWRFTAGMSGITVAAMILSQIDKIILSKVLPLALFGYYTLATALANGLYVLITPVFNATFPRMSAMVAAGDEKGLRDLYHGGTQLLAILILPVAALLFYFPQDVLWIWTGSESTAGATASIARLLVIGTALNGIMTLPYALQISYGWTKLGLLITTILILTMTPSVFAASVLYGPVGAASIWALLNFLYVLIGVPLTHRRLLVGEAKRWYLSDIAFPLSVSVVGMGMARAFVPVAHTRRVSSALVLSGIFLAVASTAALASPYLRKWFGEQWRDWKNLYA